MNKCLRLSFLALFMCFNCSCAPNIQSNQYGLGSVGQANRAVKATVISVRDVNVSGSQSGVGAGAGAVTGGVAGSFLGGGVRSNIIGAVGGAVVGGIAGAVAENQLTKQQAVEYVVETENGSLITVVQGDQVPLQVGQKVIVLHGSQSRIIPSQTN